MRVDPALRDVEFTELSMKRFIHKARNHAEARDWDIIQQIMMSPEERQRIAKELKRRFYACPTPGAKSGRRGSRNPDVRSQRLDESTIRKISREVDPSRKRK